VADPEDLLGDSDYLLSVTLHPVRKLREWKLVILEDRGSCSPPTRRRARATRSLVC
jgi:hypothetical protein